MASIDRVMALSNELKKKKKDNNYEINTSLINVSDLSNEIRSGNRNAIKDYNYDVSDLAPVRLRNKEEEKKWWQKGALESLFSSDSRGAIELSTGDSAWYKKILQVPEAYKDNTDKAKELLQDGFQLKDAFSMSKEIGKDTAGTIGGTVGDAAMGIGKGIIGVGENIGQFVSAGIAQGADWIGQDDYAEYVRKNIADEKGKFLTRTISEGQKAIDGHSVIGDTGDQVTEAVGQIASIWATGGAGGSGLATATMFGNAAGGTFADSYSKEGITDAQAWTKAIGTGLIEAGTERLFGIFGKSGLDTGLANKISSKISSGAGKLFSRLGIQASGEAIEEFISYAGNYLLDNGLVDKIGKADYTSNWNWEEVGEQMGVAFLASGVLGAGGNVGSITNNMKANNMSLKDAVNETARQQDVQGQLEDWKGEKEVLEQELTKKKLTQEDISEIFDEMQQADTKIKELEGQTAPIQAQVKEEVVQPNAQQFTEEQAEQKSEQLTLENTPEQATNKRQTSDKQATTPTQAEIDNLLNIKETKSGSEYGLAFNELSKKYGYSKLYKALNEYYSTGTVQETQTQETQESIVDNDNAFSNAPTSQNIVEQQNQEAFKNITDDNMPSVQEDTTPAETDPVTVDNPFENRDMKEAGKRSVKAYQFENPEVRPYFQEEAQNMLHDLDNTVKGQKGMTQDELGNTEFYGTTRQTAEAIAYLKDNYGYSYEQIRKGLNDIIEGKDNNAVAKRIEFLLDERLRDGYTTSDGIPIPANQDYINLLNEKQATEYNRETSKTLTDEDIAPEQIKEEISNVIQEQVKDIKTELKDLKKQIKEVQAPIKEVAKELKAKAPVQNPFELTEEQNARIQELRDDTKKWTEIYNERYDDKKFAQKRIKGVAMQNAADIRKTIQGDVLIPIEGGLTEKELNTLTDKLRKNYIGKQVLVDGKEGIVTGNAYGKIGVEFADGTKQYVDKNSIEPLEDIDSIIQEQQRMYDQYQEQNIAPEPQETVTEPQTLRVDENIPVKETKAKKQNTELTNTGINKQEQENKEYEKHTGIKTEKQDGGEKLKKALEQTVILTDMPEEVQESRLKEVLETAGIKIIDKGFFVKNEALKYKNQTLEEDYNQIKHANREAVNMAMDGYTEWNIDTTKKRRKGRLQSKKVTKSIEGMLEPIKKNNATEDFYKYMYNQLNIDRMTLESRAGEKIKQLQNEFVEYATQEKSSQAVNKKRNEIQEKIKKLNKTENKILLNLTAEESQENVKQYENETSFKTAEEDTRAYINQLQDILVDAGILSSEQKANLNEIYPHYIPAYRNVGNQVINVNSFNNNIKPNDAVGKAKGGTQDILPLDHSLMVKTKQVIQSARVNKYLKNLKDTYAKNNELKVIKTENLNEADSFEEGTSTERISKTENGKYTATVYENGKKTVFEISRGQYEALKPSDIPVITTLNTFVDIKRSLLTQYNLFFATRNFVRDTFTAALQSEHSLQWFSNIPEAVMQVGKKGQYYQYLQSLGGGNSDYNDMNKIGYADIMPINTNADHKGNKFSRGWEKFKNWKGVKWIATINEFIEQVPRMAEFITAVDNGKSGAGAVYAQDEVTVNFGRGGDWTKTADRNVTNFVNANIQGGYKIANVFRDAYAYDGGAKGVAKVLTKWAIAGGSMVALMGALWDDDEDYEELSDYIKQNYYVIGKYGDGKFIKIPKGRTNAVIEQFFNSGASVIRGEKSVGEASTDLLKVIENNLAPNSLVESSIFAGLIQTFTNTSWYGEDIVPTRLQKEEAKDQYDETTDAFSIWLGQTFGISPYKANYLLDQSTGFLGDMILPLMTEQAETPIDNPVAETFLGQFYKDYTADSVMKNQNITDIYSLTDEGSDLYVASHKTGAKDEDILKYKFLSSVTKDMNELYAEKRTIQNETGLSNSEKLDELRYIQRQIDDMAQSGLRDYEDMTVKSNYADVGGVEYYKNNKGVWKKVNYENEGADLNEFDLSVGEKNTYFKTKNKISEIAGIAKETKEEISIDIEDEDDEDYVEAVSLLSKEKKNQIVNTIINSGLNDKAKAYLYKKAYNTDTVDTIVNAGINVDDYLTYTTMEFEADYNYKGNPISNSRKNKVINYVNSLNLDIPQKAILIKATNTFKFNDNNYDIVSYVDGLNIDYSEKVKILEDIDMEVSDDGTITWKW